MGNLGALLLLDDVDAEELGYAGGGGSGVRRGVDPDDAAARDGAVVSEGEDSTTGGDSESLKVYAERWLMVAIFSASVMSNAMMFTTFSPIASNAAAFFFPPPSNSSLSSPTTYISSSSSSSSSFRGGLILAGDSGVGTGEDGTPAGSWIDLFALTFLILFLPGTLLGTHIVKAKGLRFAVVLASLLTTAGCLIRYAAVTFLQPTSAEDGALCFWVCLLGQSLAGLVQPIFVNCPGKLAANWFGLGERDTALTVVTLFSIVGQAVGLILPPLLVSRLDDHSQVEGIPSLMLSEAGFSLVCTLWAYAAFRSEPPTPPSISSMKRSQLEGESGGLAQICRSMASLLLDPNYLSLCLSFGGGVGLYSAVITCSQSWLSPCGYSDSAVGSFAAIVNVCGLVGASIAGVIMDKTHAYRPMLSMGFIMAACSCLLLTVQVGPDNATMIAISFGAVGFTMMPMIPIVCENALECTYPVTEDESVGLLFTIGNTLGVPITLALQSLIDSSQGVCQVGFWAGPNFLVLSLASFCAFVSLFYRGEYKRMAADVGDVGASKGKERA